VRIGAAAAAGLLAASVAAAADVSGPALDYALNCQGCHRADGAGTPGSVPALAGSVATVLRAPGGRDYLVRVPGVAQAALDDAALAALLNWLLPRFDPAHRPAGFMPYTADEVGRLRGQPFTDVERARREVLDAAARLPAR